MKKTRNADRLAKTFTWKRHLDHGAFSVLPPDSKPAAISSTNLANVPTAGNRFAILSNGNSLFARRPNLSESTSFKTRGPIIRGTRDLIIHRITVDVPKKANCLMFDFKFLSEEFPEFVDSEFNDAFVAELNPSTWFSDREDPAVDSPRNFARGSRGNPIRVNSIGGTGRVSRKYAKGTTYDAATRTLRAATRVKGGTKRALYLSIFDQGDRQYDSAVFIDRLRLKRSENCRNGRVVGQ